MADVFNAKKRSEVMARICSRGNKETELLLLGILRKHGVTGWRRHLRLPGKPDFAFPQHRLAVFVDGCFWHGCPQCYRRPKSRQEYWDAKFQRNKTRDRKVNRLLRRKSWRVVRFWQHELQRMPLSCVNRIQELLVAPQLKKSPLSGPFSAATSQRNHRIPTQRIRHQRTSLRSAGNACRES